MKHRPILIPMILLFLSSRFMALSVYASQTEETPASAWQVSWPDGLVVEAGENIGYQTIAANLLPEPMDGYYPGGLTIETGGQIIVKAGGSLTIGKISVGGPESSPILRGVLREDGLIRVEAGGRLVLNDVTLEMEGSGLTIVQEDGAIVETHDMDLTENIRWGVPVVDNTFWQPESLWLKSGTPLTAEVLPGQKLMSLIDQGVPQQTILTIRWTIPDHMPADEVTLTGTYLNENGDPLLSVRPLTLTVHWYTPESIQITKTDWYGSTTPLARLYVNHLPEHTDLWAEYSEDEGVSWTRMEIYDIDRADLCCTIAPPDSTPRLYRLAAEYSDGTRHWISDSVLLPKAETDPNDSSGNRGGSIDPAPPDRDPVPPESSAGIGTPGDTTPEPSGSASEPSGTAPEPSDNTSEPSGTVSEPSGSASEPTDIPAPVYHPEKPDSASLSEVLYTTEDEDSSPAETHAAITLAQKAPIQISSPSEIPSTPEPLPIALQAVLGAAGLTGCTLAGIAITRILSLRKRNTTDRLR